MRVGVSLSQPQGSIVLLRGEKERQRLGLLGRCIIQLRTLYSLTSDSVPTSIASTNEPLGDGLFCSLVVGLLCDRVFLKSP